MSGGISIGAYVSSSAQLGANVVTNAKLAQAAANTVKGNNTGSTANVTDIALAAAATASSVALRDANGNLTANSFLTAVSAAKTTTYAVLAADSVVLLDGTSAGFTATLPTAVGVAGKQYTLKRIDQTLANAITIATTSSQTIDGVTTRKLMTQYEQFTIVSDGSNWQITDHSYPSGWTLYTPTYTGWGTVATSAMYWKRSGDTVLIRGRFTTATTTATEARMTIPSGLTSVSTITSLELAGDFVKDSGANTTTFAFYTLMQPSVSYITFGVSSSTTVGLATQQGSSLAGSSQIISLNAAVPVANWEA